MLVEVGMTLQELNYDSRVFWQEQIEYSKKMLTDYESREPSEFIERQIKFWRGQVEKDTEYLQSAEEIIAS